MGKDMICLFVDGSPERMARAYQRMSSEQQNASVWCKTVEEAISVLRDYREKLEVVSLSHDLNEFVNGDTRREDGGMEIVRWLTKRSGRSWSHCKFIVHGHGDGDAKMVKRLQKIGLTADWRKFGE